MDRPDDPAITGILYRRIPPVGGKTKWDSAGVPTISPSNFIDKRDNTRELSLHMACETTPEYVLSEVENQGYGLAEVTAETIRSICKGKGIIICRDEKKREQGHVLVVGNITRGMANELQKAAKWVDGYLPRREDFSGEHEGIPVD